MISMYRVLIGITGIILMCSCQEQVDDIGKGTFSKHYISDFTIAESLTMKQDANNALVVNLYLDGEKFHGGDQYETFCNEFGDITYNRAVSQDPSVVMSYSNRFDSLDITSDSDFNDVKAGETLSEKVIYRSATAMPYIDSGYLIGGAWTQDVLNELESVGFEYWPDLCFHPVVKKLSDLASDELLLSPFGFMSLRFIESPSIKEHTLTVVFREGNKEIKGQLEVVFP